MTTRLLTLFGILFCVAIPAKADVRIILSTPSYGAYYNGNHQYSNNKHAKNYARRHNYGKNQHIINPYLNHEFSVNRPNKIPRKIINAHHSRFGYHFPNRRYHAPYKKGFRHGYNQGYYDAIQERSYRFKRSRKSYYR